MDAASPARPSPWEALSAAIAGQLIEASRAAAIERRMVRRWGRKVEAPEPLRSGWLRDAPGAEVIAGRAPAELAGMDLSGRARDRDDPLRARGRRRPRRPRPGPSTTSASSRSARSAPGPCSASAFTAAASPTRLPAGDLAYVKLVGRLAGLRRRATVPEVEEYFERFAPFRGLAGIFAAMHYHPAVQTGPPLRLAA